MATLYPPIIESSIPAILLNNSVGIEFYFNDLVSSIKSINDIQGIQVKVTSIDGINKLKLGEREDSNTRFCNNNLNILIINREDPDTDEEYDLEDSIIYLDNNDFYYEKGQIYKVQMRYSLIKYNNENQTNWLNSNISSFSEWSTYCIFKIIEEPEFTIEINNNKEIYQYSSIYCSKFIYNDNFQDEGFYSGQISLQKGYMTLETSPLLYYKDLFYPYYFKTLMDEATDYKIVINYTTQNKYHGKIEKIISITPTEKSDDFKLLSYVKNNINTGHNNTNNSIFNLSIEEENGYIKLLVKNNTNDNYNYNSRILRVDAENEKNRDFIYNGVLSVAAQSSVEIFDYLIESGKKYYYYLLNDKDNKYYENINEDNKRNFEFSYLVDTINHTIGRQLKLKFDNTINNFKYNISESKNDTLGSQYPIISRNGYVKYRTFPITGLISMEMDELNILLSQSELEKIKDKDIYYKEKIFRDKVMEFLYDKNAKLFKSPTEGNIIVKLTDINFTPNKTLNRMVYSFSANAHEVAENTYENYRLLCNINKKEE